MKQLLTIAIFLVTYSLGLAQQTGGWNGKKCAVVLTYDDALDVHLTNVVPMLDSLKLRGTFYLSGSFPGYTANIDRWRAVARTGHELGNHTLFHPCLGNQPGREWVNPNTDMSRYTVQRMTDEINMMNVLLQTLDGKTERTFAYPCGDMTIGGVDYYKLVASRFVAARGVRPEMKPMGQLNYADIGAYSVVGQTGEQLIELVEQAQASNSLLVFLFHGVGGGHSLNVALPEHNKLLRYLKQHEADIWIAPFIDAVKYSRTRSTAGK